MTDQEAEALEEALRLFKLDGETIPEFWTKRGSSTERGWIETGAWWRMPLEDRIGKAACWIGVHLARGDVYAKRIRYAYESLCRSRKPLLNMDHDQSGHHEQAKSLTPPDERQGVSVCP